MSSKTKMCFDRVLPGRPVLDAPLRNFESPNNNVRAIFVIKSVWPNGSDLHVRFMGGTPQERDTVRKFASEWEKHVNLRLIFDDAFDAQIRVDFKDDGAWSYVGTDNLGISRDVPTMNFGWLDEAVVLHEFGHAIGLGHEHSSPKGGLKWKPDVVYAALAGAPNFWTKAEVDHNVLFKYSTDQVRGSQFDPKSIMLYSFPPSWTEDGFTGGDNSVLSATDKSFASLIYPKPSGPSTVDLPVIEAKGTQANIGQFGEEDLFRFEARTPGRYTVETSGPTDVVMSLYGPNSQTALITQDDDSGEGHNARITADLVKGTYFVQVRHYNRAAGKGQYEIRVSK